MSYVKQNFQDGNILRAEHLNHVETGISDLESSIAGIEDDILDAIDDAKEEVVGTPFSTLQQYSEGEYVLYNGELFRFVTIHAAGAWNANHVTKVTAASELARIDNYVKNIEIEAGADWRGEIFTPIYESSESDSRTIPGGVSVTKDNWLMIDIPSGTRFSVKMTDSNGTIAYTNYRYFSETVTDGGILISNVEPGKPYEFVAPDDITALGVYIAGSNISDQTDIKLYVTKMVQNPNALITAIAPAERIVSSNNHNIGDLFMQGSVLYCATKQIAANEQIIEDDNAAKTNVAEQLEALKGRVALLEQANQ